MQIDSTFARCDRACRTASKRVRGLAGLADRHDERLPIQDRVAVAELGGHLDLDRNPGPVLDRVLGDEAGVVGRAAGDNEDLVDVAKVLTVDSLLVQHDLPTDQVAAQRVGNGARLLLDLLQHEVVEAALLGGSQVPADVKVHCRRRIAHRTT